MLRQYSQVPVRVFLFDQNWPDKQENGLHLNRDDFLSNMDALNVEVVCKKPLSKFGMDFGPQPLREFYKSQQNDFFLVNKTCIAECPEESVLFIDVDTFIFGDVTELFLEDVDFVACKNRWIDWTQHEFFTVWPFNGGIQLFNNGLHRRLLADLPEQCQELATGNSPFSNWLRDEDRLWNVEEFAISKMVSDDGLKYRYFEDHQAKNCYGKDDINHPRKSLIFHPYTINWKQVYNMLKRKNRFFPRFFPKRC